VEIFIGADVWQVYVIRESVEGDLDQPRALKTGLGWRVFGPEPRIYNPDKYVVNCMQSFNYVLHEQMQRMFVQLWILR